MLTQNELKQIKDYLVLTGKKDSDLDPIEYDSSSAEDFFDYVSVLQGGINKKAPYDELVEALTDSITEQLTINTAQLVDGAVIEDKLANSAVTTNKINNDSVTYNKLSDPVKNKLDAAYSLNPSKQAGKVSINLLKNAASISDVQIKGEGAAAVDVDTSDATPILTISVPPIHWMTVGDFADAKLFEDNFYAVVPGESGGTINKPKIQALHLATATGPSTDDNYITIWQEQQ